MSKDEFGLTDQDKIIFVGDIRVESGMCNVFSAPCSSCMHRIAAAMGSDVDCGSSDNTFERKEADSCSFIGVKSRSCDDLQTAASETSNLSSGSSIHDSYSENSESKATLRNSITYGTSEDVNMPLKVSIVEAVKKDKVVRRGTAIIGNEMPCSCCRADLHHSTLDGEQHVSGCQGNYNSCITGARDDNMVVLNHNLELDKRDTPCSSVSTCKLGAKETAMLIQVEATHESEVCFTEVSQVNSGKLSTFPEDSFCKKSPSPSKSDLTEPSTRKNISAKVNLSSHSQSEHISSHNADSNDMEANQQSQVLGEPYKCFMVNDESSYRGLLSVGGDHGQKSNMFTNNEASKATQVRSDVSSGEFMNENGCFESASVFGRSESNLHKPGMQHQPILHGQASESDCMLYDVNVCDICGDAGREELLATCSRCIDGAEHTYCMRIMLDKVPEGDWLCEECQLKEEIEIKKLDAESICGTSNVQYLNKKYQNLGNSVNPENLAKLNTKSADIEACGSSKEMQSPTRTGKRHIDQMDVASATSKKVSETSDEALRTASPRIGTVSHGNSFKNLHMAQVKRTKIASSPGGQSANSSQTVTYSPALGSNPSNVQRELYPPRESLSKQVSFKKNVEPKVKQLVEGVPQKLAKESTSQNTKKQSLVKTINKSTSFNSMSSGHHNIQSLNKAQSLKSPQNEDPRGFKPMKERNVMERKSSFVLDRSLGSPSPIKRKPLPNLDMKIAPLKRNSSKNFEPSIVGTGKALDRENDLGYKEVKKQSSFKSKRYEIGDSENQKTGKFVNKDVHANSSATNRSYNNDAVVARSSVSLSADSLHQSHLDDKTKGIPSTSKVVISGVNNVLCCGKLTEASHATQSCQVDRLTLSSIKPSAGVSSIDGTSKRNRWKDAVKVAMSISQKNFLLERAPHGKVISRSSDSKMDSAANIERTKHSTESSHIPGVGDLNANLTNLDELNEKPLTQLIPDHPSLLTTAFGSLVVPKHEFVWKGSFEILRIGRLPEIVDGIQAHLSNFASPKVHEVSCQFPCKIQLEEVPRASLWPLQFQETSATENNIALYFFAKDAESYERSYQNLLEAALENDLALKGNINEVELLIFPSSMLPESSQRWNMLFFLWGIFRGKKSDSLKPHTDSQEPCGSKIITDPLVQELSSSHTCELSSVEKLDLHQHPPKEFSRIDESSEPRTVMFNASVVFPPVSSTGPDDNICKTEEFPSSKSSSYKAVVEAESSELSDRTSHSYPRIYSSNPKERCPAAESNEINLGNLDNDAEVGIHANSVKQNHSRSLLGYSAASCVRQDSEGKGEIKEKEWSVNMEVGSEENILEIDCQSWGSRPNMKRAHSRSAMLSGEASKSTNRVNMWQEKASFAYLEDDQDHKRMKCYGEGHDTSNFRYQSTECRLPSRVQPLTSYLHEQQQRDGVNYGNAVPGSLKCAERIFFPLDSCPVRNNVVANYRHFLSPVDEASPESNYPDLELALGGKKKLSKKEIFPLLFPSVDKGREGKLCGPTVDEDDMSASLSLSLAFPGMEEKRTDNPVRKEDQPRRNTMILFGGIIDT